MLISSASFAATAVAVIGGLVFWSNPHRIINRFFLSFSLHLTAWLICVHQGVSLGEDPYWVRLASAIGSFVPVHMWLVKEACIGRHGRAIFRRAISWVLAALTLTIICYTEWYVQPSGGGDSKSRFGLGYFIYMAIFVPMYGMLCRETIRDMRVQVGLYRLELQILLLGGSAMCFGIIFLMALRALLGSIWPIHVQPFVVLLFYAGTVVAITAHRVFNARQILLVCLQKFILVAVAIIIAFAVDRWLELVGLPEVIAWFLTGGVALWTAAKLNGWLDSLLHFYPQATSARQAAFAAARESRREDLEQAFGSVLKGWGQSEHALLLGGTMDSLNGGGVVVSGERLLLETMKELKWATPERLARERPTPGREALGAFLKNHKLAVLVMGEGPALVVLVGVGVSTSRRPFTYPQVLQLMELASIIESAFERAHFSVKAQHAEQLATVGLLGASLAHEIRNPLVTIKTFVQLLPTHYQDPVFREKFFRLIGSEVSRMDRLTEQLLDLAAPRSYEARPIALHPVLQAGVELVAAKAEDRQIQVIADFRASPDLVVTDPSATKQVLLNLCFNALQALEGRDTEKWIRVSTRNVGNSVEVAISDNGPGISPEIMPRLFEPFQTTKSTGFGLGLAICSDILSGLKASIAADPPRPGMGATFRVLLPCPPPSS